MARTAANLRSVQLQSDAQISSMLSSSFSRVAQATRPLQQIQPLIGHALKVQARVSSGAAVTPQPAFYGLQQPSYGRSSLSAAGWMPQRRVLCCATGDASEEEHGSTIELEIKVEGMMCGGCSSRVTEALKGLDKVKAVEVDLDKKLASVEVEADSLMDAMNMLPGFVKAIQDLGFEAEPHIEYQS